MQDITPLLGILRKIRFEKNIQEILFFYFFNYDGGPLQ